MSHAIFDHTIRNSSKGVKKMIRSIHQHRYQISAFHQIAFHHRIIFTIIRGLDPHCGAEEIPHLT